jgi:N-terminal acetyltransferase B complex non-catalytic subunit
MSAAVTLERQIRPIYEALDTGSNKSAIVSCNKLLKKYPSNLLVKSLKALALVRSQKVEESLALCDEVLAVKPLDDATISAMMHVLKGLGRITDMVNMFEEAYKQQPLNEEYGAQTFFAHVRTANWKSAQQVSTRMHKQFQEDRYLYWSVMGAILQVRLVRTASRKLTSPIPRPVIRQQPQA